MPKKVKKMAEGGLVDLNDELQKHLAAQRMQNQPAQPIMPVSGFAKGGTVDETLPPDELHMYDGGDVPDIPGLTPQDLLNNSPLSQQTGVTLPPDIVANQQAINSEPPQEPAIVGEAPVADSHPGTTPDELKVAGLQDLLTPPSAQSNYFDQQRQQTQQFGPDTQLALLKAQNGLGMGFAKAGAGLADAIMQGVARAGTGKFSENLNASNKATAEALPSLQGANLKQMAAVKGVNTEDPNSIESKVWVSSNKSLLKDAGLTDDEMNNVSAATGADLLSGKIKLDEAKERIAEAQATLGEQHTYHEQLVSQAKTTEQDREEYQKSQLKLQAQEKTAEIPWYKSWGPAYNRLEAATNGVTPSVGAVSAQYQIGQVVPGKTGNYKYLGGAVNNPKSWEKQ